MPLLNESGIPLRQLVSFVCAHCGKPAMRRSGDVNRARREGNPLYCDRLCAGAAHRSDDRTPEQKKADKRAYDAEYRAKNAESRRAQKAAYHKSTYDPIKAAEERKARMPKHVEYCRRPEYRAYKQAYDQQYLASKTYGDFAEVALVLREIEGEIDARIDRRDIYAVNGTRNKKQERERDYARTHRIQPQNGPLGDPQQHQDGRHATGAGRRGSEPSTGDPAHGQDSASGGESEQAVHPGRPDQLLGKVVPVSEVTAVSYSGNGSLSGNGAAAGVMDTTEER